MNNTEKENFNPKSLIISDFKSSKEYKDAFFKTNIINTVEYYELQIFQQYFIYGFLSIKNIFNASKELSQSDKSEITYRKVNDWSNKELLEENRNTNIEWRKYSVRTGVQLLLINDLKKYGYSNEQIKNIVNQVIYDSCDVVVDNAKINYKYFDFYASTFYKTGINFSLVIDKNCNAYCLCEKDLTLNLTKGIDKTNPILILPFSKYLSVFAKYVFHRENESIITEKMSGKEFIASKNEVEILNKVRDEEVKEINITRKNRNYNKSLILKSKTVKDNERLTDKNLIKTIKKDKYTKVTASIVDEETYNLIIEKTEKLSE